MVKKSNKITKKRIRRSLKSHKYTTNIQSYNMNQLDILVWSAVDRRISSKI